MDDAEYEAQKKRVQGLFEKWINDLGLRWWRIGIEYERLPKETARQDGDAAKWRTLFRVYAKWTHSEATVYVNMPEMSDLTDDRLELSVVHELSHVLVNEMRQTGEDWLDHEERVATILANAFIWVRDAALGETRKPTGG